MLNDKERAALFLEVHREIELAATRAAEAIAGIRPAGDLDYPPNGGLTDREMAALKEGGSDAVVAYRKIVAAAAASPIWHLLCLIDGVADPESYDGAWGTYHIARATDQQHEEPMLHDAFFETYWLWRDRRPDPGWALDTLGDDHPDGTP